MGGTRPSLLPGGFEIFGVAVSSRVSMTNPVWSTVPAPVSRPGGRLGLPLGRRLCGAPQGLQRVLSPKNVAAASVHG